MKHQAIVNFKKTDQQRMQTQFSHVLFSHSLLKHALMSVTIMLIAFPLFAQDYTNFSQPLSINLDGRAPHPSAILDLSGSGRGIVFPVIHSDSLLQNFDPTSIPLGMMWYASDKKCLYIKKDIANGWVTNCFHEGFEGAIIPHVESEETDYIHSVSSDNRSRLLTQEVIRSESGLAGKVMHKSFFSVSDNDLYALPSANNSSAQIPYSDLNFIENVGFSDNQVEALEDGYYYFSADITFTSGDGIDDSISLGFYKNDARTDTRVLIDPRFFTADGKEQTSSISGILYLSDGDKVDVRVYDVDGVSVKVSRRTFSGFLLSY